MSFDALDRMLTISALVGLIAIVALLAAPLLRDTTPSAPLAISPPSVTEQH